MFNPYQNEMNAAYRRQDIAREVKAAKLGRLAKADRDVDRAVAAPLAPMPRFRRVAGAWRSLGRGFAAVVGRHAPA